MTGRVTITFEVEVNGAADAQAVVEKAMLHGYLPRESDPALAILPKSVHYEWVPPEVLKDIRYTAALAR